MFLRQQPLNRELGLRGVAPPQPGGAAAAIQERERDQPPQRGVDAPQVPEIRLLPVQVHELGHLPVRRLMFRQGAYSRGSRALQHAVARQRHADRTHGGVAPEYGRVAALIRARAGRRRQDAAGRHVFLQEADGPRMALVEQCLSAQGHRWASSQGFSKRSVIRSDSPMAFNLARSFLGPAKSGRRRCTLTFSGSLGFALISDTPCSRKPVCNPSVIK